MKEKRASLNNISKSASYIFPILLIIISFLIVYFRLKIQIVRGPGFDTYAFLANGLTMAGQSNYFEIYRPPLLPFLVSIFFRLGFTKEIVIYLIDGFFYIAGALGLYYLLRLRLNPTYSFIGGLLFLSFPDMVENVTFGITDIPAISLSIWIIFFLILAIERDRRFYLVLFPLFIIGLLTRFTVSLMIFPILFYVLLRGNLLRNMKVIAQGATAAALVFAIDLVYYWHKSGNFLIQFSAPYEVATTISPAKGGTPGAKSSFYFISKLPGFLALSPITYIFLGLLIIGLLFLLSHLWQARKEQRKSLAFFSLIILLALTSFLMFSKINFLFANLIILALFLLVIPSLFNIEKSQAFDLLLFLWLVTFLNYHSHQAVKVARYFITMAPGVAFLVALSFSSLLGLGNKIIKKDPYPALLAIPLSFVFIALILMSANFSYERVNNLPNWSMRGLKEANEWLARTAKKNDVIFADYFVASAWYMKRPIEIMPIFETRSILPFNHELEKNNADYFISVWQNRDFPSYRIKKRIGDVYIYSRKYDSLPNKPRVFLVGKDIDHYIEDILNFRFYIIREKTPFPDDLNRSVGTTYLDDYSLERLKKYRALLLYNFRWHDIGNAEKLLIDYLASGGTIIIDASGNSGKSFYDLNNVDFLGVSVLKQQLPASPKISITSDFNLNSGVDVEKFARFVDENGEPWFGSAYEKTLSSKEEIKKLVTADGKTLIGLQQQGKGRIIWIGYNFIFHAFYHKNKAEKQLIQNVFRFSVE